MTFTGKHINPLDLRPDDICIEDIAHALALCNRFAGHTKMPISVAQHSVYVSRLVDRHAESCDWHVFEKCTCGGLAIAKQALLHDASEAYLGDITKWLKSTPEFTPFREAESKIQRQIYAKFGCATTMHPDVAAADKVMLRFEGPKGFGLRAWNIWALQFPSYEPMKKEELAEIGAWAPWTWRVAEESFLTAFRLLGDGLADRPKNDRKPADV